jgi:NAD(P)-dependent dehydrogenase (short-subunit alcohol dehydrogenase family)
MADKKLSTQTAIVTGANSGIGEGVAISLGEAGANVVVNYVTNPEAADAVVDKIKSFGSNAIAIKGDVSKEEDVINMFHQTVQQFGTVDILVNNAGLQRDAKFHEMTLAQIGKGVHLSGGVGIGGVLEPLQAAPVIIEDGCFIGSRCIVVEGVRVEKEAVLGANVVLTMSTKIIDVSGADPVETKGVVPARSVVIPGTYNKKFPAGEYGVGCALIIGQRKPSTDLKTSLNDALRDFNVSV